ncbi:MAG: ribonuclease III domain-containing protein [Pseudomonadota bacterium]|nr:ribonuclease III domain-containing protein [Pseudomonadota bacterium]
MTSPAFAEIQAMFGVSGHALFLRALTRRAWVSESGRAVTPEGHHETLEFLGDAWLGAIVATRLFRDFPSVDEKELTRTREELVDTKALAEIGLALDLSEALRAGVGEVKQGQTRTARVLASHVEALIGAMYLHAGPSGAEELVDRLWRERWPSRALADRPRDYKGELARRVQALLRDPLLVPVYRPVDRSGDDHRPVHLAAVDLPQGGSFVGGPAPTLKEAEQNAARVAIDEAFGGS